MGQTQNLLSEQQHSGDVIDAEQDTTVASPANENTGPVTGKSQVDAQRSEAAADAGDQTDMPHVDESATADNAVAETTASRSAAAPETNGSASGATTRLPAIIPAETATDATAPPPSSSPPDSALTEAASHPEYYSEVTISSDGLRLDLRRAAGAGLPPPSYRALRKQIEDVCRVVRILFEDDHRQRQRFLGLLHLTADSGLRGPNCSTEIGAENLQDVKDSIADEFPSVRGRIWWWNFTLLCGTLASCGIASLLLHRYTGNWYPTPAADSIWPALLLSVFLIPLGVMIGLFAEFIFRVSDEIPYEQLRAINPGRWKPFQRAFNTTMVGYIFAAMLGVGAVQVGVSKILLNDFIPQQPALALVIGFVTGFAYPFVRDLVQQFRPTKRDATP